jgi:hypothetical protein
MGSVQDAGPGDDGEEDHQSLGRIMGNVVELRLADGGDPCAIFRVRLEVPRSLQEPVGGADDGPRPELKAPGEEEITSFQPHQADQKTYQQESVEIVCLTPGTTVG